MNRFDKIKHEYYSDNVKLDNVTNFLDTYTGEFNPFLIANARYKSKNNTRNLSMDDMMNLGDLRTSIAINYGNSVHETIELWVKYKYEPTQKHLLDCLQKFIAKYGDDYESEKRTYSVEYMLGGTMDLLSDEYLDDIKTNETMKKGGGRMNAPLQDIQVNNKNKAALQLSVYEFLEGIKRKKRVLNWDGEEWETIELEDINVTEIMHIRKEQLEKAKLVEDMF
jgi:hypothetical protein